MSATLAATSLMMAWLGCEEDDANPRVALADTDHATIASARMFLCAAPNDPPVIFDSLALAWAR